MEILNYDEQPAGSYAIAIFDVTLLPKEKKMYKRLKLCKSKNGNLFIAWPSYKKGEMNGKAVWESYSPFLDPQEEKGFNQSVLELVKPLATEPVPF